MGNTINICTLSGVLEEKSFRVVMLGIDGSGKTTILYNLKNPTSLLNIPEVYNNVVYNHESIPYNTLHNGWSILHFWDVGGKTGMRPLWQNYIQGMDAIIYVVDTNDRERLAETREELFVLLKSGSLQSSVLLIYANKTDYRGCMKSKEIINSLELEKFHGVKWQVQECVGMTGQGLYQGLDWLLSAVVGDETQTVSEDN